MSRYWIRALAVWLVIIAVETLHGIARTLFLQPLAGDFRARQISVFIGSALIFAISLIFIRWIGAPTTRALLSIGLLWLILTLAFEFLVGIAVLHLSQERMLSDYDLPKGGLMPVGLVLMVVSPLFAARLRRL